MSVSDEDADEVVWFQYKTINYTCVKKDTVSALSIQKLFNLDFAVEKVEYQGKNQKIVRIEDVKANRRYRIPENSLISNQKQHISNAVYASQAIYRDCPNDYLSENSQWHTIAFICDITRFSPQRVMLAISPGPEEHKTYMFPIEEP